MNCDTAFDLMTDAHGGQSQTLREHLEHCPRCRQMQETLAPALEWLSDPAGHEADRSLHAAILAHEAVIRPVPSVATAEAYEIARESAATLAIRCTPAKVRYARVIAGALRAAALIAVGAFLASSFIPGARPAVSPLDDDACRRFEAAEMTERDRATGEADRLIASCVACHATNHDSPSRDRQQGATVRAPLWLVADASWNFSVL